MNQYCKIFFESFNKQMQSGYDSYINITRDSVSDGHADGNESNLQEYLTSAYEKWLSTQLEGIGQAPSKYLEGTVFNEIKEMFSIGAEICDDDLPAIFVDKLLSYGDEAVDFLISITTSKAACASEDELTQPVQAIKLLGKSKTQRAVLPLINAIKYSTSELIQETARDALTNIGSAAVGGILLELSRGKRSDEAWEHMVMSLAQIGKNCPSEDIFSALKNAFRELSDKVVAASCLAEYGDGRAIPALRGYLLKNGANISTGAFYDIVAAVRQLGGRIDDLKQVPK